MERKEKKNTVGEEVDDVRSREFAPSEKKTQKKQIKIELVLPAGNAHNKRNVRNGVRYSIAMFMCVTQRDCFLSFQKKKKKNNKKK